MHDFYQSEIFCLNRMLGVVQLYELIINLKILLLRIYSGGIIEYLRMHSSFYYLYVYPHFSYPSFHTKFIINLLIILHLLSLHGFLWQYIASRVYKKCKNSLIYIIRKRYWDISTRLYDDILPWYSVLVNIM